MDVSPLLNAAEQPVSAECPTTRWRWWVLLLFCLLAMCQSCSWNVFGPIYPAVLLAFPSWTEGYLTWVVNIANIAFGLTLYPVSLGIKRFGPRRMTLFCAAMITSCALLRCLPLPDGPVHRVVVIISMLCNGAGGSWFNFGGPLLSELWFPSHQRTMHAAASTATSLASVFTYAGGALGFLVGPAVVGLPTTQPAARAAMFRLFYLEAAVCVMCTLCAVAYFPDEPRHPPSEAAANKRKTAALERDAAAARRAGGGGGDAAAAARPTGTRAYFVRSPAVRKYWVVAVAMAVPLGVSQGWGSVLFSCLKPLRFTETQAAWLGFSQTVSGCAASVAVGAVLDRFAGRLKLVTAGAMGVATAAYLAFSAAAAGYLPLGDGGSVGFAYATAIAGGCALNISVPLLFELIMEATYGWGDESVGAMVTVLLNTLIQVAFLVGLASADPGASTLWTAWANALSMGVACVALLFLRVEYRRLAVDRGRPVEETGCWFDRAVGCY